MTQTTLKTLLSVALLTIATTGYAGHLSVSKEVTLNASPSTTWKMIGNFNHLDVWHPVVVDSKLEGDTTCVGAVRLLTLGNGANITEKLTAQSENSYSYTITESPLPISGYESTISVSSTEDGKSVVKWTSNFDANGATDEEASKAILGIYDAGLGNLEKHFNQ